MLFGILFDSGFNTDCNLLKHINKSLSCYVMLLRFLVSNMKHLFAIRDPDVTPVPHWTISVHVTYFKGTLELVNNAKFGNRRRKIENSVSNRSNGGVE